MRTMLVGLFCVLLAACTTPPPDAYLGGLAGGGHGIALGHDSAGEACIELAAGKADAVDIYCGGWTEPAARVSAAGTEPRGSAGLDTLATTGPWREVLDRRDVCGTPEATTILEHAPARVLRCRQRIGGWPEIALVAWVHGRAYRADGIATTLPVIQRAIGVMAGLSPQEASSLPPSAADTLLARALAAQAYSAKNLAHYQELMRIGARANLAENFAASETAYRAAFVLQQKLLGANNPETVMPLLDLALQISDQGRFPEADALFVRAGVLAPAASDPLAPARLLHYQALNDLNQGKDAQAEALLRRAGRAYAVLLPPGTLTTDTVEPIGGSGAVANGLAQMLPVASVSADPTAQSAIMGLIETWRYRAVALRRQGKLRAAEAAVAHAETLARETGFQVPLVTARLARTAAITAEAQGRLVPAEANLAQAVTSFGLVLPQTRPVADTKLLQAADAMRRGQPRQAAELCRAGVKLLGELDIGARPDLLSPCLSAFDRLASVDPTHRQALLAEMFEAAELSQGSVTARQIAAAAARLAVHARNPRVAAAIRRRQNAGFRLEELLRQRDALVYGSASAVEPSAKLPRTIAAVDDAIARAQDHLAAASAAVQAAAPNYPQLVQQVVPASTVLKALAPHEAYVSIVLATRGGWVFLLRDGRITAAPLSVGRPQIARLVAAVRATIEPTASGQMPQFDTKGAEAIYKHVLGPVSAGLTGASDLVVAPSGALLALPFAILLTGPAHADDLAAAPWLIRQMPISYVPSAANFVALSKLVGGSRAPRPWFGFGDPHPVTLAQAQRTYPERACADSAQLFADLPELSFAQRELTATRELLGGSPADELTGRAFTTAAVARVDLKDYRVLHFATHGILPAELRCLSQPAIVTSAPPGARNANGALLTAGEVMGLDLNADTVILSACNSGGVGLHSGGESLSSLARAFFFAGARSMLVTHWSISDQASAFLVAETMRRFAAEHAGGLAEDLRAAQLAMINGAGKNLPAVLADPFFWGPFVVVGEGKVGSDTATSALISHQSLEMSERTR